MKKKSGKKLEINGMEIENINEFQKQHKENMIKSGHYARVEIMVARNDEMPYNQVDLHKCSGIEVMKLYALLKTTVKQFEEQYPMECAMSKMFVGIENIGNYSEDLNDEKEED